MKRLIVLMALVASFVLAQPVLTPTAATSAPAAPGLPYSFNLTLSANPATPLAFLSFTLSLPGNWTVQGATTPVAGKQITCNTVAVAPQVAQPNHCVLWGDLSALSNGLVATVTYIPPANATSGSSFVAVGNGSFQGVDVNGSNVNGTSGSNANYTLIAFDLTNDGIVSKADVNEEVAQVVGSHACNTGDLDKDGNCKLNDLFLMVQGWIAYGSLATP